MKYDYGAIHKKDDDDSMKDRRPRGRMINTYERHITFFKEEKRRKIRCQRQYEG